MRITAKLTGGAIALLLALTACSGGSPAGTTTASPSNPAVSTQQTTSAAVSVGVPNKSVCDTFSKEDVSKVIGVPVYSASNNDLLAGAQPTVCYYYTDQSQVNAVKVHWSSLQEAPWGDQLASIGTQDSGGLKTVTVRYSGLGDDAIQGIATSDTTSTMTYMVLLKDRGVVLEIDNESRTNVSDAAFLNFAKMVVQTVNKL